jgi:hypothetical protein
MKSFSIIFNDFNNKIWEIRKTFFDFSRKTNKIIRETDPTVFYYKISYKFLLKKGPISRIYQEKKDPDP